MSSWANLISSWANLLGFKFTLFGQDAALSFQSQALTPSTSKMSALVTSLNPVAVLSNQEWLCSWLVFPTLLPFQQSTDNAHLAFKLS